MKRESPQARESFEQWYANGRSSRKTAESVAVSERHVQRWALEFGWHERADHRDREAAKKAEREAILRRSKVLEEQRKAGELMRRRGTERLVKREIDNTSDALRAIKEGVALERSAENLPSFIFDLMGLTDAELEAERVRLLRQLPPGGDQPDTGAAGEDEGEAEDSDDEAEGLEPA